MRTVVTPNEMARADERAVAAGTPVAVLMERAGQAVAWAVRRACGGTYGKRVVIACGKGNNGGDGLVAARVLRGWGVRVDAFELAEPIDRSRFERSVARANCVVDAMFGTGFRGALEDDARWIADAVHRSMAYVVAIDIPSGVNGLTGAIVDEAVWADETVCFAALKPGLVLEPGRSYAGRVHVIDIGIDVGPERPGAEGAIERGSQARRRLRGRHRGRRRTAGGRSRGDRRPRPDRLDPVASGERATNGCPG